MSPPPHAAAARPLQVRYPTSLTIRNSLSAGDLSHNFRMCAAVMVFRVTQRDRGLCVCVVGKRARVHYYLGAGCP